MPKYRAGTFRVRAVRRTWNKLLAKYDEVEVPGFVEVEVDVDALVRQLGQRAVLSKGGVAVEASGAITVTRVKDIAGSR